jgi:B12 binding protein/radical SAM family protein
MQGGADRDGPKPGGVDVVLLSSVFGQVKIAEPMGACILAANLRQRGFTVRILEPSLDGWSVDEAVTAVSGVDARVVGISVLRDKNVHDVLAFASALRERRPDLFIVMGGHGPSISISEIPVGTSVADWMSRALTDASEGTTAADTQCGSRPLLQIEARRPSPLVIRDATVDSAWNGRGHGPADPQSCSTITATVPSVGSIASTYYDVTAVYLAILRYIDAAMIGESDLTFPDLVARVLADESWQDLPSVVFISDGVLVRRPPPPKLVELDGAPLMARDVLAEYQRRYGPDLPASILASRGCFYRCTFCSVVRYERLQSGVFHRQRSNSDILRELTWLHDTYGVRRFNFEDDNFIVKNRAGREKLHDLCRGIEQLPFPVEFTFFCRADVVEQALFADLRSAGLTGIYFGMESVHPEDLEFFSKGLRVQDMLTALDTLARLGYSPAVGARLRVMLGYITWHPLTSFASLRATSCFIRSYQAPPKLLRRKLRLYAGTEVLDDVRRLGLLDPDHPDGWRFRDRGLQGLEAHVNTVFGAVNRVRDRLRTLEKAADVHGYDIETSTFTTHRTHLDRFLCDSFDRLVDVAEESGDPAAPAVRSAATAAVGQFDDYVAAAELVERIADAYRTCGIAYEAVDLFRK